MNTFALRWFFVLASLPLSASLVEAAPPKDGRYKGTLTVHLSSSADARVEVKKSYPISGLLRNGNLSLFANEVPQLPNYFKDLVFAGEVGDGFLNLETYPNFSFLFVDVKTTATAFKGRFIGGFDGTGGVGTSFILDAAFTRVGN